MIEADVSKTTKLYKYERLVMQLFVVFLTLAMFFSFKMLKDSDTFWHIKSGEWIFNNHRAATFDFFSWTGIENHFKWINHEWLFDLLIFIVYKFGGIRGVMLAIPIVAGILYYLVCKLIYFRTRSTYFGVFIGLYCIMELIPFMVPRPQIISYCILVLFCILMEKKKYYWGIPLIILGTNFHGGIYPLYLVIAAFYLYKEVSIKDFTKYMLLFTAAVIINPYGYQMYLFTFKTLGYSQAMKYILEWEKVAPASYPLILLSYIILVLLTRQSKITLKDGLFSVILSVLTLFAYRHVAFLFLLVFPVLSPYLMEGLIGINKKLEEFSVSMKKYKALDFKALDFPIPKVNNALFLGIMITVYLLLGNYVLNKPQMVDETYLPIKAVRYIKENNINRFYHDYNYGGYLIFNNLYTMVDARADLFTPKFNKTNLFKEALDVRTLNLDYTTFFDKYKIKYILTTRKEPLEVALSLDNRYKLIYEDEKNKIFLKL